MSEILIPLLELVSKLLIYLGSAAVMGGWFVLVLAKEQSGLTFFIKRYMVVGALMALLAVGINFYAQVGSFAESGWAGMFDTMYAAMLWDSPLGYSVILRFVALFVIFLMLLLSCYKIPGLSIMVLPGVLLAASFSLIGHTAELNQLLRFLLSLHVLIALLWMGSLLPLWQACRNVQKLHPRTCHSATCPITALQQLMHRFGVLAMGLVAVLLVCGVILAYQLLGSVSELISTPYGLMLLAKVSLVVVILGFAAWHKWRLVPQLTAPAAVLRLQRSIRLEGFVGLIIVFVTVLLTTVVGPDA